MGYNNEYWYIYWMNKLKKKTTEKLIFKIT